jgi:hypothetical protein
MLGAFSRVNVVCLSQELHAGGGVGQSCDAGAHLGSAGAHLGSAGAQLGCAGAQLDDPGARLSRPGLLDRGLETHLGGGGLRFSFTGVRDCGPEVRLGRQRARLSLHCDGRLPRRCASPLRRPASLFAMRCAAPREPRGPRSKRTPHATETLAPSRVRRAPCSKALSPSDPKNPHGLQRRTSSPKRRPITARDSISLAKRSVLRARRRTLPSFDPAARLASGAPAPQSGAAPSQGRYARPKRRAPGPRTVAQCARSRAAAPWVQCARGRAELFCARFHLR